MHVYTGHSYPCRVLRDFYMHYKTIAGTKVWVGRSSENFDFFAEVHDAIMQVW